MKRIFISHPYASNPQENKKKADNICRYLRKQGFLPISPLHLFGYIDKEDKELRKAIMYVCKRMICICDEVWIFGDSKGCREEKAYAKKIGKPIKYLYPKTNYKYLMEHPKDIL